MNEYEPNKIIFPYVLPFGAISAIYEPHVTIYFHMGFVYLTMWSNRYDLWNPYGNIYTCVEYVLSCGPIYTQ